MTKFYDISPLINSQIAVFPGDVPYTRTQSMGFPDNHLTLSSINTTLHVGAHVDAPLHYQEHGESIENRDLSYYFGRCQVIVVDLPARACIQVKDVQSVDIVAERILFKTNSFNDPCQWHNNFNGISPELIDYLATKSVKLVGLDTPSVDLSDSKDLPCHHNIYRHKMAILEGVLLTKVPEGIYTLIALPLKLQGADASPVRAVLLDVSYCRE